MNCVTPPALGHSRCRIWIYLECSRVTVECEPALRSPTSGLRRGSGLAVVGVFSPVVGVLLRNGRRVAAGLVRVMGRVRVRVGLPRAIGLGLQ